MKSWMKVTFPVALAILFAAVVFLAVSLMSANRQLSEVTARYDELKAENDSISAQLLDATDQLQTSDQEPKAVAVVNGEQILSDEPMAQYEEQAAEYDQNGQADADTLSQLKVSIVNQFVQDKVSSDKEIELGLNNLNDQEKSDLQLQADEAFEEEISSQVAFTQVEGQSDADARAQAIAQLEANGFTKDAILQQLIADTISQKLYDYATQGTTLSDEELEQYYQSRLESDTQAYSQKPSDFEFADADSSPVTYIPEGVRYVKHIYLSYTDDQLASLDQLRGDLSDAEEALSKNPNDSDAATKKAELEKEIDGIRDVLAARVNEVIAKLTGGASFDALMAEYGEDVSMQDEPARSRGMALTASSEVQDPAYTSAAMALEKAGAVSAPVFTDTGAYLIEYVGDAKSGAVPLADIRDALYEEALAAKRDQVYVEAVDDWVNQADVAYYYDNMN